MWVYLSCLWAGAAGVAWAMAGPGAFYVKP